MESLNDVGVRLRPAVPGDEPILLHILRQPAVEQAKELGLLDDMVRSARVDVPLRNAMIVCANDLPIGVLSIDRRPGDWPLKALHIESDHRRKGFGSLLPLAFQEEAQRADVGLLVVLPLNGPVLPLFRKYGFDAVT